MEYRIEHDTLGEVKVPADHMWGAQTQRSSENFKIGVRMPEEIIHAFAVLKKCTALANLAEGKLSEEKAKVIAEACDEILAGKWNGEFPLVVYQTGSGTQSNMKLSAARHASTRMMTSTCLSLRTIPSRPLCTLRPFLSCTAASTSRSLN